MLICLPENVFFKVILDLIYDKIDNTLRKQQSGYRRNKSVLITLLLISISCTVDNIVMVSTRLAVMGQKNFERKIYAPPAGLKNYLLKTQ